MKDEHGREDAMIQMRDNETTRRDDEVRAHNTLRTGRLEDENFWGVLVSEICMIKQ